ncbi:hypothetical protein GLA29479_403 [Lysobacter antibioticus]|nr:hypothetical protein GLA29479_403 [Lysobacter antibioticus]
MFFGLTRAATVRFVRFCKSRAAIHFAEPGESCASSHRKVLATLVAAR